MKCYFKNQLKLHKNSKLKFDSKYNVKHNQLINLKLDKSKQQKTSLNTKIKFDENSFLKCNEIIFEISFKKELQTALIFFFF